MRLRRSVVVTYFLLDLITLSLLFFSFFSCFFNFFFFLLTTTTTTFQSIVSVRRENSRNNIDIDVITRGNYFHEILQKNITSSILVKKCASSFKRRSGIFVSYRRTVSTNCGRLSQFESTHPISRSIDSWIRYIPLSEGNALKSFCEKAIN